MTATTTHDPITGGRTRPPNSPNDDNHNRPPGDARNRPCPLHLAQHSPYTLTRATRDQILLRKAQTHMSWPTLTYTHMPSCSGLRMASPGGLGVHATTCRDGRGCIPSNRKSSGLLGFIGPSAANENASAHGEHQVLPLSCSACLQCLPRFGPLQCLF